MTNTGKGNAESHPSAMQIQSVPSGKESSRVTARCAHGRGELLASWEEVEDADSRALVMRRLIASVRADTGCQCGSEILRELGDE